MSTKYWQNGGLHERGGVRVGRRGKGRRACVEKKIWEKWRLGRGVKERCREEVPRGGGEG